MSSIPASRLMHIICVQQAFEPATMSPCASVWCAVLAGKVAPCIMQGAAFSRLLILMHILGLHMLRFPAEAVCAETEQCVQRLSGVCRGSAQFITCSLTLQKRCVQRLSALTPARVTLLSCGSALPQQLRPMQASKAIFHMQGNV